jgi:tripartite-type tricarboxylate transporter receptor subunit TctC
VEGGNWFGVLAPARTPMEATNKLAEAIAAAARVPVVMEVFRAQAAVLSTNTPEAFGRFIAEDRARWEEPVRALDIKID